MDLLIAKRLNESSTLYDPQLKDKVAKNGRDYIATGLGTLSYYICDFDACNDLVQCWAPVGLGNTATGTAGAGPSAMTASSLDRTSPFAFIHPMAATEMETLATFISQILAGGPTTRKVEPRRDQDEASANMVNELLQWNDDQQPTYLQTFLWCKDALVFNRGIAYDHWQPIFDVELEEVDEEMPYEPQKFTRGANKGQEKPKPADWKPETFKRFRKSQKEVGGFTKIDLISPYDFICDPSMPITRFQEGRFAGHRVLMTWLELERRSKLDPTDYEYVLPEVVKKLKKGNPSNGVNSITPSGASNNGRNSRSYFERTTRGGGPVGIMGGSDKINKHDGGIVECWLLTVKMSPKALDLYEDDTTPTLIEILIAGETNLLSVNILPNRHNQFPYAVGEARPNAHFQFSPSWTMIIKPIQDYVDMLKNRHRDAIMSSITGGSVYIYDPICIDIEAFLDPKKQGMVIPLTEQGRNKPIDSIFKQIPTQDMTAKFHEEMLMWISQADTAVGSQAYMQGSIGGDQRDPTATEFAGTQQMGTGRVSTIARNLSVSALVPQTRRIVMNAQQFMPDSQTVRITGDAGEFDPDQPLQKFMEIRRDKNAFSTEEINAEHPEQSQPADPRRQMPDIQGEFDVVVSDGSLPGTDAKKVAGLTRLMEASGNPTFAPYFADDVPGNLDAKLILFETAKATGVRVVNLLLTREQAMKNLERKQQASGGGITPPDPNAVPQGPPQQAPAPPQANGIPSASEIPITPTAAPPAPNPAQV